MSDMLHVSSSPHIRSRVKTNYIMQTVILALMPTTLFGIYNFGSRALAIVLLSIISCVATEYLYERFMHKKITIRDCSAVLTGLLIGLNVPHTLPFWMVVLAGVFAILVIKQLFGGLGQNFMNPAMGARCFLMVSFSGQMTNFVYDGVTSATPMALIRAGEDVDPMRLLIGNTAGSIGETSTIAIMIGAIFLLYMGIIDLRIPGLYIVSFVLCIGLFGGNGFDPYYISIQLCGGGLMLGAWFMATDYVTTPITKRGAGCLWDSARSADRNLPDPGKYE